MSICLSLSYYLRPTRSPISYLPALLSPTKSGRKGDRAALSLEGSAGTELAWGRGGKHKGGRF